MPKIPVVSAEPGGRIPNSPDYISAGESPGAGLVRAGAAIADTLTNIGVNLQKQQDNLQFATARTAFETLDKSTRQNLEYDEAIINDPSQYEKLYVERMRAGQDTIREGIKSKTAAGWYNAYLVQKYPEHLVKAKGEGLKLQAKAGRAQLDILESDWSKAAAEAAPGDSLQRDDYREWYADSVLMTRQYGHIDDEQAVARIKRFDIRVLENQSMFLANGGSESRDRLRVMAQEGEFVGIDPTKLQNALAVAVSNEETEERRTRQNMERAKDFMMDNLVALGANGKLTDDILQPIINNDVGGLIKPQEGLALKELNEKAPNSGNSRAVGFLLFNLHTTQGPMTRDRVEQAKRDLKQLVTEGGHSKAAEQAADHINNLLTTVRTTEAAELNSAKALGEDIYKSTVTPLSPFEFLRPQEQNERVNDLAEINKRIVTEGARTREAVAKIIEDVRKKREAKIKGSSETDKLLKDAIGR